MMKRIPFVPSALAGPLAAALRRPVLTAVNNPVTARWGNKIRVPEDLRPVTTYDPDEEAPPEAVGMSREGMAAIWEAVEDLYRTGISPGMVFCLRRHGRVVFNRAIGHSHGNGPGDPPHAEKRLMTPATPICQFSASKAVTAMLVHLLAEQNRLDLMDPVVRYIPEFARHGKEKITLYHLLIHHGGIPTLPPEVDPEIIYDHKELLRLLCDLKPNGHHQAYHTITSGTILGEVVERVTGRTLREFLHQSIQQPLGFRYFNYGVAQTDLKRVAENYATGLPLFPPLAALAARALNVPWEDVIRISNDPRFMKAVVPSGNLVATADEMARFFQLLLDGGTLDGVRIFSPDTVRRSRKPAGRTRLDGTLALPMRYSPGFMLGHAPVGLWGLFSQSAFGHVGFINIFCWADPERDIAASLQTTGKSLVDGHLWYLVRLIFTVSRYCSRNG